MSENTSVSVASVTTVPAAAVGPRMVEVTATGRRIHDDGEVRCGDIMYQLDDGHVARRLCGGCSRPDRADEYRDGCGDLLERCAADPVDEDDLDDADRRIVARIRDLRDESAPGLEERAVERWRRERA